MYKKQAYNINVASQFAVPAMCYGKNECNRYVAEWLGLHIVSKVCSLDHIKQMLSSGRYARIRRCT